jgi:monofunctional biosynthetic peptidoglycan transglycosylase
VQAEQVLAVKRSNEKLDNNGRAVPGYPAHHLALTRPSAVFTISGMNGDRPVRGGPIEGARADPPWASSPASGPPLIAAPEPTPAGGAVKPRSLPRKRSWLSWLSIAVLLSLGLWCLYEYATLPDARALIDHNPENTALIRARDEAMQSQGKKPRHRQYWIPLGAIAPRAIDAVIASEDASFFLHHGIDFDELKNVLDQAWNKQSLGRGASTITQQLAKNLWLSSDRSLLRKAKELILARRLEQALPKKRILALYLNVVEWGDGVYGIEAGSREHFGVSASQLSVSQGAILAAMLPAPRRWTPESHSPALRKRALWIVDRLEGWGKISAEDGDSARGEIERLLDKDRTRAEDLVDASEEDR